MGSERLRSNKEETYRVLSERTKEMVYSWPVVRRFLLRQLPFKPVSRL